MSIDIDIELLARHKPQNYEVETGCFTNWLGLKTDSSLFAHSDELNRKVFEDLPTGGDRVYGGYPEYYSFLTALEQTSTRQNFSAVELGAGWGPWISSVGVVAKRMGFSNIDLVGVEADHNRCDLMKQHLARNGLSGKVIHGAAWHENTVLQFPKIHLNDHGGSATKNGHDGDVDYRGFKQEYENVNGYTLESICSDIEVVDYMHWDIQGAELMLAQTSPDFINNRVRFLFIGTHSRPIDGALIEFFYKNKWDVLLQVPCNFKYDRHKPSIEGMTTTDGEIFAKNPRFN